MSLRVWLPLNGTLENKGLDNVTVTNSGATVDNNGKIGKCYSFDGSSYIKITMPTDFITIKNKTVAAWVKSSSSVLALGGISNDTSYKDGMITLYTSGWQFGSSSTYKYVSGGTIANTNVWHHVCCTCDDTTVTTYLDGTKVTNKTYTEAGITTFTLGSNNFIEIGCDHPGGDEYLTGSVNDFRIYDHCLSPLEVKQISQGLILHYPLNRNGWGQENLLKGTQLLDKDVIIPNGVIKTVDAYQGFTSATYDNSSGTSFHELLRWGDKVTVNANEIYTASFYAKSPTSATLTCYFYKNTSNIVQVSSGKSSTGSISTEIDGCITLQLTPNWTKYWITWTFNDNSNSALKTLLFRCLAGTSELSICGVKLEKGSIPTPWCPNSSDALATTLGLNNNVEYDTSGYGNNGIRTGMFSWTSDTPKYNVSQYFQDYTQYISCPVNGWIPTALTLSCWVKSSNKSPRGNWHIPLNIDGQNAEISIYKNGQITTGFVIGGTRRTGNFGTVDILDGQWHMLTVTFDGNTRK